MRNDGTTEAGVDEFSSTALTTASRLLKLRHHRRQNPVAPRLN
jgi:hypothetical protein